MKQKEYKQKIADLELELTACYQVATERTQRIAELEKENQKLEKLNKVYCEENCKILNYGQDISYWEIQEMRKLEQENAELKNLHFQYQNENNSLEIENSDLKKQLEKQKIVIDRFNEQLSQEYRSRINSHNERVKLRKKIADLQKELESYKERFDTNEYIANFNEMMKNYFKLIYFEKSKSEEKFPKAGVIDTSQKEVVFNEGKVRDLEQMTAKARESVQKHNI